MIAAVFWSVGVLDPAKECFAIYTITLQTPPIHAFKGTQIPEPSPNTIMGECLILLG